MLFKINSVLIINIYFSISWIFRIVLLVISTSNSPNSTRWIKIIIKQNILSYSIIIIYYILLWMYKIINEWDAEKEGNHRYLTLNLSALVIYYEIMVWYTIIILIYSRRICSFALLISNEPIINLWKCSV